MMDRDDKHALFAAAALHALLLVDEGRDVRDKKPGHHLVKDAVCYADMMRVEIEKEDAS